MARQALVIMLCKCGNEWARVGEMDAKGRIGLGPVSAPGAADDPTTCQRCHSADGVRFSVMAEPKSKRQRKTTR